MVLGTLKHAQIAAIKWNRQEIARMKADTDECCTLGPLVHLLIYPLGAILISFAGPHVGVVPRHGNKVVAQFEMSTQEIEEPQD